MLVRIAHKLKTIISNQVRNFRIIFNIPIEYHYKEYSIKLPANHMLPVYQKYHPKYDRFLPHLVKYIEPSDTVIDVGANVGDTLAGIVRLKPFSGIKILVVARQ